MLAFSAVYKFNDNFKFVVLNALLDHRLKVLPQFQMMQLQVQFLSVVAKMSEIRNVLPVFADVSIEYNPLL